MYFLVNGPKKRRARKARASSKRRRRMPPRGKGGKFVKRATVARRRVRRTKRRTQSGGVTMARRRRRRRAATTTHRRRRRRRAVMVLRANPRRRSHRRRRHHVRRYRRNPGMGGGIVSTIKQGVKDGALVLVGQTAQGRAASLAAKFVPVGGIAGEVITGIGSAVVVTVAARKFLPNAARMVAAGAFANAVRRIVSVVSPTAAGLLGDSDGLIGNLQPTVGLYEGLDNAGMGAYPGGGLGAYPGGGLGDGADDGMAQYVS